MLALTGSTGKEGGGFQVANAPVARGMNQFGFSDFGACPQINFSHHLGL
ncbi:MAG: hypothetical protein Ct9H300mP6_06400 [Gammaproteobacteria bacterium]|nr:MAG: hypothetical protein Ct9H300mP6_06400 [Gammaproteobacteria bacterium]